MNGIRKQLGRNYSTTLACAEIKLRPFSRYKLDSTQICLGAKYKCKILRCYENTGFLRDPLRCLRYRHLLEGERDLRTRRSRRRFSDHKVDSIAGITLFHGGR